MTNPQTKTAPVLAGGAVANPLVKVLPNHSTPEIDALKADWLAAEKISFTLKHLFRQGQATADDVSDACATQYAAYLRYAAAVTKAA